MSNENDDLNPHALDDAAKQALLAELDKEDGGEAVAAAAEEDAGGAAAAEVAGVQEPADAAGQPEPGQQDSGQVEGDGNADGAAAETGAEGEGQSPGEGKINLEDLQRQINGLKNALIEERNKNKQFKSLDLPQAPKDFAAEKKALREKWDAGEMETEAYQEQRDAITLEQARFESALTFAQLQQKSALEQAQQSWAERVTTWEKEHEDFLSNPLRRKAVNDLMDEFDRDPNNRLSDDDLLRRVQETAFEAFNWTPKVPHEKLPQEAGNAQLQRQVAAARAASAASSVPPPMTTGAGSASEAGKIKLDELVENPSKLSGHRSAIDAILGDEA